MIIIPALDIKQGKVVQRIKTDKTFSFFYDELQDNPVDLCKLWRSENAGTLFINDLDGEPNSLTRQKIEEIIECMDIPIILNSASDSVAECEHFLKMGYNKVAICKLAIDNKEQVKQLIDKYGIHKINFMAIVDKGYISYWGDNTQITLDKYLEEIIELGARRLIYGDTEWIGNLEYANTEKVRYVLNKFPGRITLFCGIPNYRGFEILKQLNNERLDSVILSKSLYENNFPCQELWRKAEML